MSILVADPSKNKPERVDSGFAAIGKISPAKNLFQSDRMRVQSLPKRLLEPAHTLVEIEPRDNFASSRVRVFVLPRQHEEVS